MSEIERMHNYVDLIVHSKGAVAQRDAAALRAVLIEVYCEGAIQALNGLNTGRPIDETRSDGRGVDGSAVVSGLPADAPVPVLVGDTVNGAGIGEVVGDE